MIIMFSSISCFSFQIYCLKMVLTSSPNTVLLEAVGAIVESFKKHSRQKHEEVDVVEALQEFWDMKLARGAALPNGSNIIYEISTDDTDSFVCFVTLPGGSCFGSFEHCDTGPKSKQSAARIALVNSVFNEHPTSQIDRQFVTKAAYEASHSFGQASETKAQHFKSIQAFKDILGSHIGENLLRFQEAMSVFQLLHWNGSLHAMKNRCCSKEEVIQHYAHRTIDSEMRKQVALDWMTREGNNTGVVDKELELCNLEVNAARMAGQELRFKKEKVEILRLCQLCSADKEQDYQAQ